MTAAEIVQIAMASGIAMSVTAQGKLRCVPPPRPGLASLLAAHRKGIIALLIALPPYAPGPCAAAAGCNPDGFGWHLPEGLAPVLDECGRFRGWLLSPSHTPKKIGG